MDVCKGGLCGGGPVSLSNSVNMADAPRLEEISTQNHLPAMKLAKLLNGQLLLCKVFTGKGLEEMKEGSRLVFSLLSTTLWSCIVYCEVQAAPTVKC